MGGIMWFATLATASSVSGLRFGCRSLVSSRAVAVRRYTLSSYARNVGSLAENGLPVVSLVKSAVSSSLSSVLGEEFGSTDPLISLAREQHGDYQSNVAMSLAKRLRKAPKDVASSIVSALSENPLIEKAEVSGPGFINLHLSPEFLLHRMVHKAADESGRVGIAPVSHPERTVIDFSSPNIAKEMHVGHLRSTVIGAALASTLEFLGHDVLRLNHVGDWGTQFGMLIVHLRSLKNSSDSNVNIQELSNLYKAAKARFDSDPEFQMEARQEVVRLQAGDAESVAIWNTICDISRREFQGVYDLLNVTLKERGESFYNSMLSNIVEDLKKSNLAVVNDGAQCVFLPQFKQSDGTPLPLIVQKQDGGFLYATTDLAAIRQRVHDENADHLIYVTDAGQSLHFQMVFETAKAAGWLPPSTKVSHVPFGLVLGEDGKKIKSRSGESVKLRALLDEALALAEASFVERNQDDGVDKAELKRRAKIMGIAAVKYADLSMNRESNYRFSFEKMLALQGNTAPYMLYAYVRIQGIKRNVLHAMASEAGDQNLTVDELDKLLRKTLAKTDISKLKFTAPDEIALAKHLVRCDENIRESAERLAPNRLCDYMFELSQHFNAFYEHCPVMRAETDEQRLLRLSLCSLTSDVLGLYLRLLGIETLEQI